ncbi:MAG: putative Ig domain-containing protein [Verrucomicrobia bacterium]|nr:putative Ig domain-containing protein [Verrucomicrobiota bacterium]
MYRKWIRYLLAGLTCSYPICQVVSDNILMPNAEISITPAVGDFGAFSFLGELGAKNLRGSGTYGVFFTPCHKFKTTGEFLAQRLEYNFSSKHKTKWVSQYSVGGAYQYLLPKSIFQSADLGVSYSRAFGRNISSTKALAGSDGAFGYIGSTISLWKCAFFSAAANYDYVKYHRHFKSPHLSNGFGGSMNLVQRLPRNFSLRLTSEFRRPFYFYEGRIDWNQQFRSFGINCGLYGNYTDGKSGLPNVTAGGVQLGFSFGGQNQKCCRVSQSNDCYFKEFCDVKSWVSSPAVYQPIVLSITDEKIASPKKANCSLPTSSTIPVQLAFTGEPLEIDIAPYFQSSNPLTFSAVGLPDGATINSSTGGISWASPEGGPYSVTVTGTSSCGSTSQTFILGVLI